MVLGGGPALFGAYGVYETLRTWRDIDFLKTDDLVAAAVLLVVSGAVALWGLWRIRHPAHWIELDRSQRVLTLGLGGPRETVPFDRVGTLEVKEGLVPVKRGYVRRWEVRASGIPQTTLFVTGDPQKAAARKSELEALLRFPAT